MNTLLVVVVDSDVRAKDTEVGKGTPLTSPFIEGIYGLCGNPLEPTDTDPSTRSQVSLAQDGVPAGLPRPARRHATHQ
jgi:hypothetical protein